MAAQYSLGVISVVISDVKRQLHDLTLSLDHSQEAMSSELSGSDPLPRAAPRRAVNAAPDTMAKLQLYEINVVIFRDSIAGFQCVDFVDAHVTC